ncbi:MAG: mechanosensitive ion channel domain-containing protein [Pseudomonadota bacterium]
MVRVIFALAVLFSLSLATSGAAQSLFVGGSSAPDEDGAAALLNEPLTTQEATALISRLSDAQVREVLLAQMALRAEAAQATQEAEVSDFLFHATAGALSSVTVAINRIPLLFEKQGEAFATFYQGVGAGGLWTFLGLFVVTLMIGGAVEYVFRLLTRPLRALPLGQTLTLRKTFESLFRRLLVDVMAVGIFVLTTWGVSLVIFPENMQPYIALIGWMLVGFPRMFWAVSRFFFAPQNPEYRIVYATDANARAMVRHSVWLALLIGLSTVIVQFNALNGVPMGETRIGFWLNLVVHIYVAVLCWRYRDALSDMMRGKHDVTSGEEVVARIYPYFMIFMAIFTWYLVNVMVSYGAFELLQGSPHYVTIILLTFVPAMDTGIRGLVRHLVPSMMGEGAVAERAYRATLRSYIRIGRIIVFGIVLILLARAWGLDPAELAAAGVGERLAARAIEFLIVLSFGYLIYEVASLYINRKLAAEITASGYDPDNADFGGDGGGSGGSRLSTVLPLVLMVTRVTIIVIFVLLALGNVGVDTTPLLAGAGIVGLAIGFGAQKLVTDVVSGIFFLVDDAFRTGEYVEIDGTMGTVEKISVRSLQLRHHKGPVHTIPYGEVPKITNYSRDWVIMKLKFTVPFETDPNKVKKIFKKIGQDLLEDELLGEDFLQPFKSQGVFEIDEVGMVIRGKFMAKPGKQFMIRKEIFNRVKAAFAENGIDFARREVRVALSEPGDREELSEEDRSAIAAAASQAVQQQHTEEQGSKDGR